MQMFKRGESFFQVEIHKQGVSSNTFVFILRSIHIRTFRFQWFKLKLSKPYNLYSEMKVFLIIKNKQKNLI